MAKTQRWDWAITLELEELSDQHLHAAYKLNWDSLCKFDSCRKNCKRILCLACFDKSWIDNESANTKDYDNFETNCEQKRTDLKSFVGLKNLGATCYVNCLLQLWFHNPALRKAVYAWDKDCNFGRFANHNNNNNPTGSQRSVEILEIEADKSSPTTPAKRSDDKSINTPQSKATSQQNKSLVAANNKQVAIVNDTTISPAEQHRNQQDYVSTVPIEQLQLVFARLQFTNKKSIDPFNFIESLALNAAEQQDAQEFGNLFMELLEKSFANQKNTFVSKMIQNQFCGSFSYATICDHCKNSRLTKSKFYELDLSIQNLETLHDCLNEYFRPVPLDGKYNCEYCQKAQSAHRKIILDKLPPTLNLQLLRFIYDVQRNVRQKLNSHIIFPEVLDMSAYLKDSATSKSSRNSLELLSAGNSYLASNGGSPRTNPPANKSNIYILSAVLIHRGSSPHSGHYIAHIKDRVTKDWYKFNDDSVDRIGPQLQVSTDGESITIVDDKTETIRINGANGGKAARIESKSLKSKTAYMLVYQSQDNEALKYSSDHDEGWVLPDHLQIAVAEENSKSDELFESIQIAKEVDMQVMQVRKNQIKTIYENLVCRDPSEKFEFIDKNWLQNWLTNSSTCAKFPPIDNSHLMCHHDKLDFRKIDQVKCVRSEGCDLLYKEFGGGTRLTDAMCRDCVALEIKLIQLKEKLKDFQKFITSQSKFKLDANYDFEDAYIVGKKSYRDWQALVMCQFEKDHPELLNRKDNKNQQHASSDEDDQKADKGAARDSSSKNANGNNSDESGSESEDESLEKFVFNSDILCEHNELINDTSAWRIVPKEVWEVFRNYFGQIPDCPLIERNANTIMCAQCKLQEVEQQEIGDLQKMIAQEQKSKLPDLFHNRKRASWCSMKPDDVYYALDRSFLSKWQKFLRNPSHQEQPEGVKNEEKLICEHGRCLFNTSNSNPLLPECPFILISQKELDELRSFYAVDHIIRFTIHPELAEQKLCLYLAAHSRRMSVSKKSANNSSSESQAMNSSTMQLDNAGDHETSSGPNQSKPPEPDTQEELDLTEIDWSECVVSEPDFCSQCHEALKEDELKKLLNYDSATIYITKVESSSNQLPSNTTINNDNCDIENSSNKRQFEASLSETQLHSGDSESQRQNDEEYPFKRRRKIYIEDEANDFVPPGVGKQIASQSSTSSSLRRTTRRNRNREQAYTIKPTQTLLQLKKDIFSRCQVLPVDQRLFIGDVLLDDNSKTMSELRIVPNCSLKLEVDKPVSDNIDLIEDEPSSRKSVQ